MADTIILYPSSAVGHYFPMLELAHLILTHHPSFSIIILLTNPPSPHTLSTTTSITFHHLPPVSAPNSSFQELSFLLPRLNNPNVYQFLHEILQDSSVKVRAFVLDFFCNAAFDVGQSLKIPTYYYWSTNASGLVPLLGLPNLFEKTLDGYKLKSNLNGVINVPGAPPIPLRDAPPPLVPGSSAADYDNFISLATNMAKSSGIIVNTFEMLEPRAVKALSEGTNPVIYCIGPLVNSANDGIPNGGAEIDPCLEWLNLQPKGSVVFLSFGSLGLHSKEQLMEIAVGLEKSGHRFLWVVRNPPKDGVEKDKVVSEDPNLGELLPKGFLERTSERGLVVKSWAPQVQVLSHDSVGGFVTHCGWNSTLEAVSFGVPMVAWPMYHEQRMNRLFLVEEMKVALPLDIREDGFVSAVELEQRVRELMESDSGSGEAVKERVKVLPHAAMAATREGGSSSLAMAKLAQSWLG